MPFDEVAKPLTFFDCLDLGRLQGAPRDEPHAAAVSDQPLDTAYGQRQGLSIEVSGQPVVALGVLERGDVEQLDEIAVIRSVFELPCALAKHGQTSSFCQSLSCSGSSSLSP